MLKTLFRGLGWLCSKLILVDSEGMAQNILVGKGDLYAKLVCLWAMLKTLFRGPERQVTGSGYLAVMVSRNTY